MVRSCQKGTVIPCIHSFECVFTNDIAAGEQLFGTQNNKLFYASHHLSSLLLVNFTMLYKLFQETLFNGLTKHVFKKV
jgi:hypothetical protein